jgi:hypothetical protein
MHSDRIAETADSAANHINTDVVKTTYVYYNTAVDSSQQMQNN